MAEHEHTFDPPISGVVAGHDGSDHGRAALAWAVADAARRAAPLHVVRAWLLSTAMSEAGAPFGVVPSEQEIADAVAAHTRADVEAAVAQGTGAPSEVHVHAVHGASTAVLLSASRGADLLVVAHRGRGGFAGLSLGSTALQVVAHAHCPVVVVQHSR